MNVAARSSIFANAAAVARLVTGGAFLLAAVPKLFWPVDFLHAVYAYRVLGPAGGLFAAAGLPWLELVVAIALLGGWLPRAATLWSSGLLLAFAAAQGTALWNDLTIDCGCGLGDEPVGWRSVLRTGLFLLCSLVALAGAWSRRSA